MPTESVINNSGPISQTEREAIVDLICVLFCDEPTSAVVEIYLGIFHRAAGWEGGTPFEEHCARSIRSDRTARQCSESRTELILGAVSRLASTQNREWVRFLIDVFGQPADRRAIRNEILACL